MSDEQAVASDQGCACRVCRASQGDEQALAEVMMELDRMTEGAR